MESFLFKKIRKLHVYSPEDNNFLRKFFLYKNSVSIPNYSAVERLEINDTQLIKFKNNENKILIMGDDEQLYRVFVNLIKNSEDSIWEKKKKDKLFKGKINIEIDINNDYINISLIDNGVGIEDTLKIMTPYFTTKKSGTGLGLSIVSKIINEHKGEIAITNSNPGVKVLIMLPKIN